MSKVNRSKLDTYRRLRAIHLKQRTFWLTCDPSKRRHLITSILGYRAKYAPHLLTGALSHRSREYARSL